MGDLSFFTTLAVVIEFGGAIIVATAVVRSLAALLTGEGIGRARLLVITGTLSGLSFKTAATLLKAVQLGTWHGIATFAAILTLRTFITQVFVWERGRLTAGGLR